MGNDTLTGGAGVDWFIFDTPLNKLNNVDTITDFSAALDTSWLDSAVFTAFTRSGSINPSTFCVGHAARDPSDRIIYDAASGNLSYDADGSGPNGAIRFAILDPGLALTAADFWVAR